MKILNYSFFIGVASLLILSSCSSEKNAISTSQRNSPVEFEAHSGKHAKCSICKSLINQTDPSINEASTNISETKILTKSNPISSSNNTNSLEEKVVKHAEQSPQKSVKNPYSKKELKELKKQYTDNTSTSKKTNTNAIIGFILSVLFFIPFLGIFLTIAGFILSIIGLTQINKNPEMYSGKGFAIAGIVISAIILLILFLFISLLFSVA